VKKGLPDSSIEIPYLIDTTYQLLNDRVSVEEGHIQGYPCQTPYAETLDCRSAERPIITQLIRIPCLQ